MAKTARIPIQRKKGRLPASAIVYSDPARSETDLGTRTSPLDRAALHTNAMHQRAALGRARREKAGLPKIAIAGFGSLMARLNSWKPLRVFSLYGQRHGSVMAAGAAYKMFFSIAAILVVGFSILGILASGNQQLQDLVVEGVAKTTPGLINTGDGGLATPQQLFHSRSFGWALVISTAVSLLTSLRWIAGLREGMRGVFGLLKMPSNIVMAKIKDLGVLLLLGISLILTTGLGVIASTALHSIIEFLDLESTFSVMLTRVASLVVMLLLDSVVAVILFRLASGITMPRVALLESAFIAGAGSTTLRYFSSLLLGSASSNPILAPFAVILGLFVWFYLLSQIYLLATSWGAVTTADIVAAARRGNPKGLRSRSAQMRAPASTGSAPVSWLQDRS